MRIISFIEDRQVIRAIPENLGLWLARARPLPKIHDPPVRMPGTGSQAAAYVMDDAPQLPFNDDQAGWYRGGPHVEEALEEAEKVFVERGV
jgi:hypothetical protein